MDSSERSALTDFTLGLSLIRSVVFEFFDYLNRFYGVVTEFCTVRNCPSMSAGPG